MCLFVAAWSLSYYDYKSPVYKCSTISLGNISLTFSFLLVTFAWFWPRSPGFLSVCNFLVGCWIHCYWEISITNNCYFLGFVGHDGGECMGVWGGMLPFFWFCWCDIYFLCFHGCSLPHLVHIFLLVPFVELNLWVDIV